MEDHVLSEFLRGGGMKCPYCGSYGLDRDMIDSTKIGKLVQPMGCWDCGKNWIVEYNLSRIVCEGKKIGIFDAFPTTTQEAEAKLKKDTKRSNAIKRLIAYAKTIKW